MKINTVSDIKQFLKKNILLGLLYPIVIFFNLYFLKEYKTKNLLSLFIIINLTNQFDIGLIKNTFFNKEKYKIKIVIFLLIVAMVILSFISLGIIILFQKNFKWEYIYILFIGLLANEFKSYQDSRLNYLCGFFIKNVLNLLVIFIYLNLNYSNVFYPLTVVSFLSLILFLYQYKKMKITIKNNLNLFDFKFFALNIFTFISGNVDRFLVIPFIGQPLRNNYLYYSETNGKLNGLFGFLNNFFLYKHLKLKRIVILLVSLILIATIFTISFFFNMNKSYFVYSLSLIVSVFSQYFIYSKIGDLKGLSSSLFPLIGMLFYLIFFYIFKSIFDFNLLILTITIILKSLSETIFVYLVIKKQTI